MDATQGFDIGGVGTRLMVTLQSAYDDINQPDAGVDRSWFLIKRQAYHVVDDIGRVLRVIQLMKPQDGL